MQFMHKREYLNQGDVVVVDCSHCCNVRLMSDFDFNSYRQGRPHRYHGGRYERLPLGTVVPSAGYWNITLNLGCGSAFIRHSIGILQGGITK